MGNFLKVKDQNGNWIDIPAFKGDMGVGIASVVQTTKSTADDGDNIITVTLTNGTKSTFTVQNGSKGSDGESGSFDPSMLANYVPTSRTVNGKALNTNISLTATDVGARANTWMPTAANVGAVPTSRTVNGKALSGNISLTASDVGAAASSHSHSNYVGLTGNQSIAGEKTFSSKITQGSPSADSTVASMNRFHTDLFVQGDGSAPNVPKVAGFYLGKSASDENRHIDIVSGDTYSYIDFNKASNNLDYDVRLLVDVSTGYSQYMWDGSKPTKILNIHGTLQQYGVNVATMADLNALAANGATAMSTATIRSICK